MIFIVMLVGFCAAFSIDATKPMYMNITLATLAICCFGMSFYVKYFLEEK